MPPDINAKRPRVLRALSSSLSLSSSEEVTSSDSRNNAIEVIVKEAEEMSNRAKSGDPLLDSEIDDIVCSLQNLSNDESGEEGAINWTNLRALLSEAAHLPHKDWEKTGQSASSLRSILLGDDEGGEGEALTSNFRQIFERVISEGNWDGAASHASEHNANNKPWAVLVTGVNGIRKTTTVYQPWFNELLTEALVTPAAIKEETQVQQKSEQKLPTGSNSFFRQLDHMIATLTNEEFKGLYALTEQSLPPPDSKDGKSKPDANTVKRYSDLKAAIFSRYRTLSEILGVLLVREARRGKLNIMVETSGRDIAMFHYIDKFFPVESYNKLALHFTINDLSCAEQSVDGRMIGEIADGIEALKSGETKSIVLANAGGPYGSEVLRGVQEDSDRVWDEIVMKGGKDDVGGDWYKATIAIDAHPTKKWTATAILPDGSRGKSFTFDNKK
eukprot:CAMPEP_0185733744 /NCGR_PEP_ID=MMETSP1171-20130828/20388_1 /TAXON_ID=374046 /ORGANISM="Helicotheca tamensis, Strain CCMP826" /LENGTH=443 /DNA_ID=CAMNT_0028403547 /DNA_START=303 /DNA_END=1634 /DNA_ORIENTATION=-